MLNYNYYLNKSPHAHHGASCSKKRMTKGFQCFRQACTCICPLPQLSLAIGPRFVRLEVWLHEEDTWLKEGDSLCGAKTAGFSIKMWNPCSPGRKVAYWSGWSQDWEVWKWEHHHGGRCIDRCLYQVGIIRIPPTNFTFTHEDERQNQEEISRWLMINKTQMHWEDCI